MSTAEQQNPFRLPSGKPTWMNTHPCGGCGTGYVECAQGAILGLMCCAQCGHPGRWATVPPYTDDEIADMHAYRAGA